MLVEAYTSNGSQSNDHQLFVEVCLAEAIVYVSQLICGERHTYNFKIK